MASFFCDSGADGSGPGFLEAVGAAGPRRDRQLHPIRRRLRADPSAIDRPVTRRVILDHVAAGSTLAAACLAASMVPAAEREYRARARCPDATDTCRAWLRELAAAREIGEAVLAERMLDRSADGSESATRWLLERRFSRRWAAQARIEHSGRVDVSPDIGDRVAAILRRPDVARELDDAAAVDLAPTNGRAVRS